eukprot:GHVP01057905.1.p2 GENE.GHVP01057905.1~~GHVP01057905.1.p2  ORF type:complete len:251 (+),score=50.96 GHVP01057905.1:16-768(+)
MNITKIILISGVIITKILAGILRAVVMSKADKGAILSAECNIIISESVQRKKALETLSDEEYKTDEKKALEELYEIRMETEIKKAISKYKESYKKDINRITTEILNDPDLKEEDKNTKIDGEIRRLVDQIIEYKKNEVEGEVDKTLREIQSKIDKRTEYDKKNPLSIFLAPDVSSKFHVATYDLLSDLYSSPELKQEINRVADLYTKDKTLKGDKIITGLSNLLKNRDNPDLYNCTVVDRSYVSYLTVDY